MLYYKQQGKGPSIVFIHGYLENGNMWEKFAEELSEDYQSIIMDLPGHGKSKSYSDTHSMDFMAEKVNEILDELNISEALFIGHSMGGYVALAMADLFPEKVKGFILLNSSSLSDTEEKKENRLRAVDLAQRNLPTLIKMSVPLLFQESKLHLLKAERDFVKEMAMTTSIEGVQATLRGMSIRKDRTFILNEFDGEIGIVLGKFDRTIDPEPFKKVIPNRENIEILELETAHMSYLEDEIPTLDFIKDFSSKVFIQKN